MRILIVINSFESGGAQRRVIALATAWRAMGHDVTFAVIENDGELKSELADDVIIHTLGSWIPRRFAGVKPRATRLLGAVIRLKRLLQRERPYIVLAGANHVILASLLAYNLGRRKLANTHLALRFSNTLSGDRKKRSLTRPLKIALLRRFIHSDNLLIAVSQHVAGDVAKRLRICRERLQVPPNPVIDTQLAAVCAKGPDHDWLKDKSVPVILGVGRLHVQKDFATLIKAFALMRHKRHARLIIYGEGEERRRLQQLIDDSDHAGEIDMPGYHPCPWREMRHADMLVLPSRWEGMPGVLIEAMAAGCPVISTDCPGGSREILRDGALGPLVPVGDTRAMARAMEQVLIAPVDSAALQDAASCYDVRTAARAYLTLFSRGYASAPGSDA